ncbi:MAG: MATE family efflux transporter [Planctomycetes bacterium]|nr:MATE family efflux transporter [Planctomycetota bacterium]
MTLGRALGTRDVLRLAWPSALSYLLNSAYRINDQYWVQGLGADAQAALSSALFVAVMNFSMIFLAAGGTLALTARATGARDPLRRDRVVAQAVWIGLAVYAVFACLGPVATPHLVGLLKLDPKPAAFLGDYLSSLYLFSLPLVFAPIVDHAFIGVGNTLIPSLLELGACALNYLLSPILIYGSHATEYVDHPGAALSGRLASWAGIEGLGIAGAPVAIACSRAFSVSAGMIALRVVYGVRWYKHLRFDPKLVREMLAIGVPVSLSIALYAGVYGALIHVVVAPLGVPVLDALGIGLAVFEGLSFPLYLGVGMAGASLVGRAIGARDPDAAWQAVRATRRIALYVGATMTLLFVVIAPIGPRYFSTDPEVVRQTSIYVALIAFSQLFVAQESANEKILLGAGYTARAMWVSMLGNGLRVPLGWYLGVRAGFGALGVWWALNATSVLKAALQFWLVQRGRWLTRGLARVGARESAP